MFILNFIAIIPLANLLGVATEVCKGPVPAHVHRRLQLSISHYYYFFKKIIIIRFQELALRTGEIIGGLLNATFGNAVELILSIAALQKGLITVVQVQLLPCLKPPRFFIFFFFRPYIVVHSCFLFTRGE